MWQAAAIAGLIGLAAGAGMNGLLLAYFVIISVLWGFRPPESFLWLNAGGLFVEGIALACWIGSWRQIRRLPEGAKWLFVAGCWALTILNLIVFSLFIR